MSDETTPLILGDAAIAELGRPPRRKWFGRKRKARPPLTHCENCGAPLTGPFCAQCGQPAIDYHRSFGSLLVDAADAFFNFDARFFQSFGLLLFKPWRLTNEFVEGKRARHVHPLRVYLIASVIFFLVINFLARDTHFQAQTSGSETKLSYPASPQLPGPVVVPSPSPAFSFDFLKQPSPSATPVPTPGLSLKFDGEESDSKLGRWIESRAKEKIGPTGDRGDLFLKALIQNLAPMVLCCIPLFALVLKILYVFKRRFYIEHLIFALHTHAFVFLSTVIIIGLGFFLAWRAPAPFTPIVCSLLGVAVVVQLLIAIRRVYRQNWLATLLKFALGTFIYAILLAVAFGVTAAITLVLP